MQGSVLVATVEGRSLSGDSILVLRGAVHRFLVGLVSERLHVQLVLLIKIVLVFFLLDDELVQVSVVLGLIVVVGVVATASAGTADVAATPRDLRPHIRVVLDAQRVVVVDGEDAVVALGSCCVACPSDLR